METDSRLLNKGAKAAWMLLVWAVAAWLLYPLVVLDSVDMASAKPFLYRSAFGIAIMLILFGKTVFDLFFPQTVSKRSSFVRTALLTVYSLAIAGGMLFMVSRMIVLYIKNREGGGFIF